MANTINDYYENSILSDIAYYNLNSGMTPAEFKSVLMEDRGIAEVKAEYISTRYQILETSSGINAWASGFSATLFYDTQENKKVLAIRGTNDVFDLITDAISVATIGSTALQYQYQDLKNFYAGLVSSGVLGSGETFTVAGHSLGGFLTQAFAVDYSSVVSNAYTYNAPGIGGGIAELLEALGVTSASIDTSRTTNILSEYVIGGLGTMLGSVKDIFIENGGPIRNHSITTVSDSLAVYNLLAALQPTLTLNDLTPILQNADYYDPSIFESLFGSSTNMSLENIVNGMGDLFGAGEMAHPGDRDELYTRIKAIEDSVEYQRYEGTVSIRSTEGISVEAGNNLAYRYAVMNLNSFAILADDTLYDRFSSELALYDPLLRTGELTNSLVQDKSYFLNQLMAFNKSDDIDNPPAGNTTNYFKDFKTKKTMNAGLLSILTGDRFASRYIFGDSASNQLNGGNGADKLYGGAGNDVLRHTEYSHTDDEVSDYLEGGSGRDTYYVGSGDVVMDTDGLGQLIYTDAAGTPYAFSGGRLVGGNYVSDDNKATYTLSGMTLTIQVQGAADAITVNNFSEGDLGITLNDVTQDIGFSITGDLKPIDLDPEAAGIQGTYDEYGNYITSGAEVRVDRLKGSGGDDFMDGAEMNDLLWGYAGNDTLYGGTGNDILNGGAGDDRIYGTTAADLAALMDPTTIATTEYNMLSGSAGNDFIVGGFGNDEILGGSDNDFIIGGPGDDNIIADGFLIDTSNHFTNLNIEASTEWGIEQSHIADMWLFVGRVPNVEYLFVSIEG